jgi:hypothetical protein
MRAGTLATLALVSLAAACQLVAPLSPLPPRPDGGGGDAIDAAVDDGHPDAANPDVAPPDAARPDVARPDAPPPDVTHPDAPPPDVASPDAPPPDVAHPDAPPADAPTADAPGSDGGRDSGDASDGAGQSRFVVVGQNFTNGWSADGVTWNVVESPAPGLDATAVAYGGGVFVSVGQDVRTSPDGATWALAIYNARAPFLAVTYSDGYFIASGAYGFRMRSSDGGQTWSDYTELTPEWLYGIAAGNGIAVAVTSNFQGTAGTGGWTSSQDLGQTWTPIAAAPGPLGKVAFGNGVFVAVGSNIVATTTNGTDWAYATVDAPNDGLLNVFFLDGQFYIISGDAYWRSPDGVALTKQSIPLPPVLVQGEGVYVGAQYFRLFEGTRVDVVTNVVYQPMQIINLNGLAFGRVVP